MAEKTEQDKIVDDIRNHYSDLNNATIIEIVDWPDGYNENDKYNLLHRARETK